MKKAFILGIMVFFAIGMIQNANAQARETSQQQSTQASESVSGASKVETNNQTTQTVPPRRIGNKPLFESQINSRQITPGQDMKGDARFNARNGRTGKRVSTQQTNASNPETQKPAVKTNSNNSYTNCSRFTSSSSPSSKTSCNNRNNY